jgi:nicotinamidase-related amidase
MKNRSALLVVDVQESFRQRPYFGAAYLPAFFDRLGALLEGFGARGLPIVRILHVEAEGAFSLASGLVVPMKELPYTPAATFHKSVHSALSGTGLGAYLTKEGVNRLVISGIRTEQCCETTTRHASDSGFAVDYVTEATLTFPMRHKNGRDYSVAEIKERTELVLTDRFATITTAAEALARLD